MDDPDLLEGLSTLVEIVRFPWLKWFRAGLEVKDELWHGYWEKYERGSTMYLEDCGYRQYHYRIYRWRNTIIYKKCVEWEEADLNIYIHRAFNGMSPTRSCDGRLYVCRLELKFMRMRGEDTSRVYTIDEDG